MFLLDWYKQWIEIRQQKNVVVKEEHVCLSCETLNQQLELANFEKKQLLDRILQLTSKEPMVPPTEAPPLTIQRGRIPWRVRQQMLEQEDRAKAAAQRNAAQADTKIEDIKMEDLEKELEVAAETREQQSA